MSIPTNYFTFTGSKSTTQPGVTQAGISQAMPYEGAPRMQLMAPHPLLSPTTEISAATDIHGGVPCVGAGHWPISHILERLASGLNAERIIRDYPDLTLADIQLAIQAAAWVMRDPEIDWSTLNLPGMLDFQDEIRAWQSLSDDALGLTNDPPRV